MTETDLYEMLAQYLNLRHPSVVYHFDLSGLWTPSHKARNLYGRLNKRAWPDLFIAGLGLQEYLGLFIELKKEGTKLYLKDGVTMVANPHFREQAKVLDSLRAIGYKAEFACGFEQAKLLIDDYLL